MFLIQIKTFVTCKRTVMAGRTNQDIRCTTIAGLTDQGIRFLVIVVKRHPAPNSNLHISDSTPYGPVFTIYTTYQGNCGNSHGIVF